MYGVKILGYGMSGCIFGSGFITYSLIGFFGGIFVVAFAPTLLVYWKPLPSRANSSPTA